MHAPTPETIAAVATVDALDDAFYATANMTDRAAMSAVLVAIQAHPLYDALIARWCGQLPPGTAEPAPAPRVAVTAAGGAYLLPGIEPASVPRGGDAQLSIF